MPIYRIIEPANNPPAPTRGRSLTVRFEAHDTQATGGSPDEPLDFIHTPQAGSLTLTGDSGVTLTHNFSGGAPLPDRSDLTRNHTFRNLPIRNGNQSTRMTLRLYTQRDGGGSPQDVHTFNHIVDDARPSVTIELPPAAPSAGNRIPVVSEDGNYAVLVRGRASDTSPIDEVEIWPNNEVNRKVRLGPGNNWSGTLPALPYGNHTLRVQATDRYGNVSTVATRPFELYDDAGPVLHIDAPTEGVEHIVPLVGGVANIVILGYATDPSGVSDVTYTIDGGSQSFNATLGQVTGRRTDWSIATTLTTGGPHTLTIRARDTLNHVSAPTHMRFLVADPIALQELSYAGYLLDLINFAEDRIRVTGGGSGSVDAAALVAAFHQPFDRLAEPGVRHLASKAVSQVRIAVEVLRQYNTGLSTLEIPAYSEAAYYRLLANLGTSYAELRVVRDSSAAARFRLARRLGLGEADIDLIFLAPEEMTEANLQRVFGLRQTQPEGTSDAVFPLHPESTSLLFGQQLATLRASWQDQHARETEPAIDPDLLGPDDFAPADDTNLAWQIYTQRQSLVQTTLRDPLDALRVAGEPVASVRDAFLAVFADLTTSALELNVDPTVPEHLWQRYVVGEDVDAGLSERGVSLNEFLALVRLWQVANSQTLLDSEWEELLDILVSVRKRRLFPAWVAEEGALTVSPDFFTDGNVRPPLIPWRYDPRRRRNWERRLAGRTTQLNALRAARDGMIEDTETATLPLLRDALVQQLDRQGYPNVDLADWLTRRLAISFKYGGSVRISRLEQAVQTLQEILVDLRSGRLLTLGTMPLGSMAPNWELDAATITPSLFDVEWQWMGDFGTWRGAMTAVAYPENLLFPSLAGPPGERSTAYNALLTSLRQDRRLTPFRAQRLADEYASQIRTEQPTVPEAPVDARDLLLTSALDDDELQTRRAESKKALEQSPDLSNGGLNEQTPHHLKEIYFLAPMAIAQALQRAGQYQAALDWYRIVYAFDLPAEVRKIHYGLEAEEERRNAFVRPDDWLQTGLDVHRMALDRTNASTRFTLMSIARCLLAYADVEFTRETTTSVPRARRLYQAAEDIVRLLEVPPEVAHVDYDPVNDVSIDASGNQHALTLYGATWVDDPQRGWSLSVSASARAEIAAASALDLGAGDADFSVAFWVQLRGLPTGQEQLLIRNGATGSTSRRSPAILVQANTNRLRYRLTLNSGNGDLVGRRDLPLNQWVHVACVKVGHTLKGYVNGSLDAQISGLAASVGGDGPIFVGAEASGANPSNALMQGLRLFDVALSADAVIRLAELNQFPDNPVADALKWHAQVNLRKLRAGLNIAGMERVRIEPAAVELEVSADGRLVPPPLPPLRPTAFRYAALIERAKQLVNIAQQMESNFLSAVERASAAAYTLLQAEQDVEQTQENGQPARHPAGGVEPVPCRAADSRRPRDRDVRYA